MQIRIEAFDLPGPSCGPSLDRPGGHHNVHVGVPRRGAPADLLGLTSATAPSATWTLDCTVHDRDARPDLRGPHLHGPPGARFVYLSWGTVDDDGTFAMFRRAKLMLDAVPDTVMRDAIASGTLVARLGLTDPKGHPRCAAIRPPDIEWGARRAQPHATD